MSIDDSSHDGLDPILGLSKGREILKKLVEDLVPSYQDVVKKMPIPVLTDIKKIEIKSCSLVSRRRG